MSAMWPVAGSGSTEQLTLSSEINADAPNSSVTTGFVRCLANSVESPSTINRGIKFSSGRGDY